MESLLARRSQSNGRKAYFEKEAKGAIDQVIWDSEYKKLKEVGVMMLFIKYPLLAI